ncbi:MAG TPA: response regulator transcription factor [Thermohalobaculum sp.]|nr:response regulator transcription factor [Thermohalobaculum sp.]
MAQTILIVDDDPHILEVIGFALERAGFQMLVANDGLDAVSKHASAKPDLIILDINLPEMDGLEACREIRRTSDVPILFLSSRDEEVDRIVGLEIGGDDYVSKPFSPRELVARVKVILKRGRAAAPAVDPEILHVGDITQWTGQHKVSFRDVEISLTATEFRILTGFLKRPQLVRDRQAIIDIAHGGNIHVSDRTVDSHVRHIRAKFQASGCDSVIETVHGVGYKLGTCR